MNLTTSGLLGTYVICMQCQYRIWIRGRILFPEFFRIRIGLGLGLKFLDSVHSGATPNHSVSL